MFGNKNKKKNNDWLGINSFFNLSDQHSDTRNPTDIVMNNIVNQTPNPTDPNGSYTGVPLNPLETPVQDVDDL